MRIATREDIRRAAGRAIVCGFDGTTVTAELREVLREVNPLGLILFARNVESPEQVAELNRELKSLRPRDPLLVCVDQEGGRVARVRSPATEWPPLREVGQHDDPQLAAAMGQGLARELLALGFDVDFAPVLDVDTNPDNPVIGDRSFGEDPDRVARLGAAMIQGIQAEGLAACAKHFPGHGDTDLDSHLALPKVSHEIDRLREVEWQPFRAAIAAGVGAVMTAHVIVEALDPDQPGTLSPVVIQRLRQELSFKGVVVSDDLEMKAVANLHPPGELALRVAQAGVDLLLCCRLPEVILEAYRGLVQGVEQKRLTTDRLLDAEDKNVAWRQRFYHSAPDPSARARWVGCRDHALLSARLLQS